MRKIESILMALIILGCIMKEESVKTFTAHQVSENNIFSYGSVTVKINPDHDYLNISGTIVKDDKSVSNDPTTREFYIFTRSDSNKIVLVETHTRGNQNPFRLPQDELMQDVPVIQKGRKSIDGKTWEVYTRALPEFPAQILSAVRQKGIRIEQYRCGLEIGVGKLLDRYRRIYIRYIKGIDKCETLPQNGGILSDDQLRSIREFANHFDENITISDQSGGS
jgi:hypothetical protein